VIWAASLAWLKVSEVDAVVFAPAVEHDGTRGRVHACKRRDRAKPLESLIQFCGVMQSKLCRARRVRGLDLRSGRQAMRKLLLVATIERTQWEEKARVFKDDQCCLLNETICSSHTCCALVVALKA